MSESVLPDAAAVRRALERRDLVYGLTVDQVMSVVGPVLEERDAALVARDAEIGKLRAAMAGWSVRPGETRTLGDGTVVHLHTGTGCACGPGEDAAHS